MKSMYPINGIFYAKIFVEIDEITFGWKVLGLYAHKCVTFFTPYLLFTKGVKTRQ